MGEEDFNKGIRGQTGVQRATVPASFKERRGLGDGSELWTEEG